nr:hypothetical protein [Nicotiana tabacum]
MSMLTKALPIPLNKIPASLDQLCLRVIRGNQMNHSMQTIFKISFKNDLLVTQIPCQHKATVDGPEFSHILGCTIQILKESRHPSAFILTKKKGKQGRGLSSVREDRVFNFIHAERQEGYFSASTVLHFSPTGSSRSYSPCPSLLCNRTVLSLSYLTIGDGDDSFQRRRRLPGYPVKDEEKTFH